VVTGVGGINASTTNTQDNNFDFYQIKVDVAVAQFFNPGLYYIFGRNAATTLPQGSLDTNYIGFTATGKVGIVSYTFDFVYGSAEGGSAGAYCTSISTGATVACTPFGVGGNPSTGAVPTQNVPDVSGYALDASVSVPIGPVTLNFAASYASGDDRDGGDSEAYPGGIGPSWNGPGGLFQLIGSGGLFDAVEWTQDAPTNLWAFGLTADYRPVKQLLLTAGVAYAGFAKTVGNCAYNVQPLGTATPANPACYGPSYQKLAGRSTLGVETFLLAQWDIWTGFKLQGEIGYLIPPAGVTAQEYVLQMLYSF
jgi:hypothetical protein